MGFVIIRRRGVRDAFYLGTDMNGDWWGEMRGASVFPTHEEAIATCSWLAKRWGALEVQPAGEESGA